MSQDLQLNKRCHRCENIPTYISQLYEDRFPPSDLPFHNINELIQSAKRACHVCNLILAEILESQIRDLQRELEDKPQHGSQQLSIGRLIKNGCLESGLALKHMTPGPSCYFRVDLVEIHLSYPIGE